MKNKESTGFSKLHHNVKKWVWDKKWHELRDIQEEAINPILSASKDIVISASTAEGKTEAAYLPICSYIIENQAKGIQVLYVSPLKSLINDQYSRLEELCNYCNIEVNRWHGDVSPTKKKKLIANPSGLLLITPESLEALFIIHSYRISTLFKSLSFVIIDELHSFLDNERGKQLQSLLNRLELSTGLETPRIGLSATIGDMTIAANYIRPDKADQVHIIESTRRSREIKLQIRGYRAMKPDHSKKNSQSNISRIANDIFNTLRGSDNLIFSNTRRNVELYSDLLKRMSQKRNLPNEFFPHHGNLSKEIRHDVENRIKEKEAPTNVVCTSTLELGIDIGSVISIAQIGCPPSVTSILQRLGRSGRNEGDPSILRIYIQEDEISQESNPNDELRVELFQAVAMIELILLKWLEPLDSNSMHLSTLIQQLLSLIAQYGGITTSRSWSILCENGSFASISKSEFSILLRKLIQEDLIIKMQEGTLVLGLLGERIVNHYSFYAAFTTADEYRLLANGKTLGTLPISDAVYQGVYIIFAGQRWLVMKVNSKQKVIELEASKGGKPPIFSGSGIMVHERIRKEMQKLYLSDYIPIYLNQEAVDLWNEGKENFNRLSLNRNMLVAKGESCLIYPWAGDKIMNTIKIIFSRKKISVIHSGIALEAIKTTSEEIILAIKEILNSEKPNPNDLAGVVKNKIVEKYDQFLPEELLCSEYAAKYLDVAGALQTLSSILD